MEPHIARSLDALPLIPPGARRILDLGSGGGLPGLPLALATPEAEWVLLDGSITRGRFLQEAVAELQLGARVSVVDTRAEEAGRLPGLRGSFDAVLARSFGPPAVTAECASPFLKLGGVLIVAEPPEGSPDRWPMEGVAALGLEVGPTVVEPSAFQVLRQVSPCPERFPRRTGIPAKRPLF